MKNKNLRHEYITILINRNGNVDKDFLETLTLGELASMVDNEMEEESELAGEIQDFDENEYNTDEL